jgi:hypothetical protein
MDVQMPEMEGFTCKNPTVGESRKRNIFNRTATRLNRGAPGSKKNGLEKKPIDS